MAMNRTATLRCVLIFIVFFAAMALGTPSYANPYTTNDDLSITFDGLGRATDLTVDSYPVLFSSGETGGFYIRDNTIDPGTGLPLGLNPEVDNLLVCSGFQNDGVECLSDYWTETVPTVNSQFGPYEPSSGEFVAQATIDEAPGTEASWAALSQVVNLNSISTTTNDLYYLMFEMATESGWRPYDHPDGHDPELHGNHKIFARVEWFGTTPDPLPALQPDPPSPPWRHRRSIAMKHRCSTPGAVRLPE